MKQNKTKQEKAIKQNKQTVLLVENDDIIRNILEIKLRKEGYTVLTTDNGNEAFKLAVSFQPDIITTDIVLKEAGGIEFISAVRKVEFIKEIPILVFSNQYAKDVVDEAKTAGATDYLIKTDTTSSQFVLKLKKYIGKKHKPTKVAQTSSQKITTETDTIPSTTGSKSPKRYAKYRTRLVIGGLILVVLLSLFMVNLQPFHAFGGAMWLKDGVHFMSDAQISTRIEELNAPKEAALAEEINKSTPNCSSLETGFCQRSPKDYVYKTLVTPAVQYVPGTPGRKEIIGYCTLCNDGTFSPSCAVGRGACSWHEGVNSYNVAQYRTSPGTPAVEAKPASYSYVHKSYSDSNLYSKPNTPSLETIVGF